METDWDRYYNRYETTPNDFRTPSDSISALYEAIFKNYEIKELLRRKSLRILIIGTAGEQSTHEFIQTWKICTDRQPGQDQFTFIDLHMTPLSQPSDLDSTPHFIQADGRRIPFDNNSFDVIITHHLFDCADKSSILRILEECRRVTNYELGINFHCVKDTMTHLGEIWGNSVLRFIKWLKYGIPFYYRTNHRYEEFFELCNLELIFKTYDEKCYSVLFLVQPNQ